MALIIRENIEPIYIFFLIKIRRSFLILKFKLNSMKQQTERNLLTNNFDIYLFRYVSPYQGIGLNEKGTSVVLLVLLRPGRPPRPPVARLVSFPRILVPGRLLITVPRFRHRRRLGFLLGHRTFLVRFRGILYPVHPLHHVVGDAATSRFTFKKKKRNN